MKTLSMFHILGLILMCNIIYVQSCDDHVCDELYKNVDIILEEVTNKFIAPFVPPPVFRTMVYNRTGIDIMNSQQIHDTVCKVLKVTSVKELAEVIGLPYEEVNSRYSMITMQPELVNLMIQVGYPTLKTIHKFRESHKNATFPYKDYCCYKDVTELLDTLEEISKNYTDHAFEKLSGMIGNDPFSQENEIDLDKLALALYESEDRADLRRISGLDYNMAEDVFTLFGPGLNEYYSIAISGLDSLRILKEQGLLDLEN